MQEFLPNNAPVISIIEGPLGGENYSENISLTLSVTDEDGDGYTVVIRLNNSNYSIDLPDCAVVLTVVENFTCNINIPDDLSILPINRNDWNFHVIAVDDNSSYWTTPMISTFSSNNFSIWWTPPVLDLLDERPPKINEVNAGQNRAFFWGVVGVVVGVIVAAGIMFRGFENRVFSEVPPPFREEE